MTSESSSGGATEAEARHHVANLLHTYTAIADRKDVDAAVSMLGCARLTFPAGGYHEPTQARAFFEQLWTAPQAHRHDVTNLVVHPCADRPGLWTARAHYTRWLFTPDPILHTLGEYTLTVDELCWSVVDLTVTRTWTRG
jgi:hypothetical protein